MTPSSSRFTRRWKTPAARSFWSIMRVTTGFTSLTLMLLVGAWMLGLLPDHAETALRERRFLTESMAITYAGILQVEKPDQARPMMAEVFRRTPELLSAGIRDD